MLVRMMVMAFAMMMLAPSAVKGDVIEINFNDASLGAYFHEQDPTSTKYITPEYVMGDNYSAISYAKVGNVINYKYSNSGSVDISRLAFAINTNGTGNTHNNGYGFYLRAERGNVKRGGLYTGNGNSLFAVLGLKPGDNVKITYAASSNIGDGGANIRINNESISRTWCDQLDNAGAEKEVSIDINFIGDLNIKVNAGTYIEKITITTNPAQYEIKTNGNESTFEFTKDGTLEENDYAVPYLAASFGSINDYLLVQNGTAHMIKADGSEDLVTDPSNNYQPSAGSFYAFKPTAGGHLKLEGSYQGQVHLFIYDPSRNGDNYNWVPGNSQQGGGQFYVATYSSGNIEFDVEKDKIYYICQDNNNERGNAFHLHKFTFTHTFGLAELAKVIDNVDSYGQGQMIELTSVEGVTSTTTGTITVKRCTGNIVPTSFATIISEGKLKMGKPTFVDGTDHAGTVIIDVNLSVGEATFVVTFPYHADYRPAGYTDPNRSYGHTWNFIDPRNSDSNSGNSKVWDGNSGFNNGPATTGILSIGQYEDLSSQMRHETDDREWTYSQRQTGTAGGFHDPYYANVYDMEGDNADMIWETEGLWFDTGTNLSCIYNEKNALAWNNDPLEQKGNPVNFKTLQLVDDSGNPKTTTDEDGKVIEFNEDPDRYVGLLPVTDGKKSSFTIPGLKPGDRVLIFMKSGEATGDNGIFLNITGAKDALGKAINPTDLYKAGGTNWQHNRYEGCYHFIKDETKDPGSEYGRMTFSMNSGSMCKLLYIRIYTGQRIVTTNIVSSATGDAGRLLFMNDKGAALGSNGQGSQMSLRFRGKGQHSTNQVLTYSGNLNAASFTGDNFKVTGAYNHLIDFKSKVGEIGMFRLRMNDITYEYEKSSDQKITYVADFCDRNFTVGYRDKVDKYPYTWDFTDIQGFSSSKMDAEADNYPIAAAANDAYGYEWDISLFDAYGNMKVNTGWDPITNNLIFSPHKIGFGNQLWAGGNVIPETRGLWFYSEDDSETGYTSEYSSTLYNGCLQITSDGIRFANVPDQAGKRVAWWNYKMVVPDVPADGAVYLRMKRDTSVPDDAKTHSTIDNADVPFVATRFQFASQSAKTEVFTTTEVKGNGDYAFYKVPNTTTNEWILAVKNTTGNVEHLTFTLNGWIVKKVAVSTDAKTVNRLGWATESRARVIDPALTSEMTGYPFETYIVTDANYANKTVTLQPVKVIKQAGDTEKAKVMPAVEVNEDGTIIESTLKNAYIIRNTKLDDERIVNNIPEPGRVQILNNGFHLFVPDMHDYVANRTDNIENQKEENVMTNNMLVSLLTAGTVVNKQGSGNIYNYALTSQKNKVGDDTQTYLDEIGFYRIKDGTKSSGNQGYLPVDCTVPTGTTDGGGAKMSIIFDSFDDPAETVETAIEVPFEKVFGGSDAVYYNLNGQKLSGKPTQGGLYIVNGKKVMVK